jgi:acetyl esterase
MPATLMKRSIPLAQRFDVTVEDVEYQRPAGKPLLARIYRPVGTVPTVAVLDIHGGAWTSGDRTTPGGLDQAIASSGALVVSIDFRMPPDFPHPWQVRDAHLGVRWLKQQVAALGAARDSAIGLEGGSSGGHVAILLAMRPDHPDYGSIPLPGGESLDATVDFVVTDAPVTHPHRRLLRLLQDGREDQLARFRSYWRTEEEAVDGSLNLMLQRGERVTMPPILITQGTEDESVPVAWTSEFVDLYRAAGGMVEFRTFPGVGHGFIIREPARRESLQQAEATLAFVHKFAKPTSAV